jgi:hypothetical protein
VVPSIARIAIVPVLDGESGLEKTVDAHYKTLIIICFEFSPLGSHPGGDFFWTSRGTRRLGLLRARETRRGEVGEHVVSLVEDLAPKLAVRNAASRGTVAFQ